MVRKITDGLETQLTPILQTFITKTFTLEQVARISAVAFKIGKRLGKEEAKSESKTL